MNTWKTLMVGTLTGALMAVVIDEAAAGDPPLVWDYPEAQGVKELRTEKDLPGTFNRYYGQRRNQFNDFERKIAAIDLDADLNYDGAIDDSDPADGGAFEQTPPGLVLGEGEMSKLIIRVRPYRVDYEGAAVVAMELTGINRGDKSGAFGSLDEEIASTSRVRVWRDSGRTELLLDSSDPGRRYVEWSIKSELYPANIPNIVPRTVYVEGVSAQGAYTGDMRVLVTVSHRGTGETVDREIEYGDVSGKYVVESSAPSEESKKPLFKRFRTSFDHLLVTVAESSHPKEYINNNAEGVWVRGGRASGVRPSKK